MLVRSCLLQFSGRTSVCHTPAPECTAFPGWLFLLLKEFPERLMHLRIYSSLLQKFTRVLNVKFVFMGQQLNQLKTCFLSQIDLHPLIFVMSDLEHAPKALIMHTGIGAVALVHVIPVYGKHRAGRIYPPGKPLRPGIICIDKVLAVGSRISGALPLEL